MIIVAGTVVAGGAVHRPGWLEIDGTTVHAVGSGAPPRAVDHDLGAVTVVPGFVDIHVHGGGGATFDDDHDRARTVVDLHRSHGTTTMVASLVTASPESLPGLVSGAAQWVRDGLVAGLHLEGPWLSAARCGAHQLAWLRDPDPAEVDAVLAAGDGTIAMITLAPERRGGMEAIRALVEHGIVAAVGHTDADYDLTRRAIEAGARVATHLFNAMRPLHHREPGPVLALTADRRVTVEMIMDGVHLHPALYADVVARIGADRVALVTDAMAAAGMGDGRYELGPLAVDVTDGVARLAGGPGPGSIAGSTATMDQVFGHAVRALGEGDEALLAAVRQTSATPATVLGRTGHDLAPGGRADLVALDGSYLATAVLRDGRWLTPPA